MDPNEELHPGEHAAASGARQIDSPEAEPLDLLALAGDSTMRRLAPAAGGIAIVFVVLWRLRARRASRPGS